jgi:MinD-like ATPase involved in chromosome partitioning or flagellar assembly
MAHRFERETAGVPTSPRGRSAGWDDLGEEECCMKTITFFSYKGGVGRTLATANFAVYLAKLGLKVVIMDFDLDAPGVDSKFPAFTLPSGQLGLIDYILRFQRDGSDPGPVKEIVCTIPISSPRQDYSLSLIPAGDYLSTDYSAKLNELNWSLIFSKHRDGVAFFQVFLDRIENELSPDVLVIDSRTGFSEIGGLCTQQLADETVILSSLARESIKMTSHLVKMIGESEIANQLKKKVETKIVVSRVPKHQDIDKLKTRCCNLFDVQESKLFFLFSCRDLEQEEFVAMLDTQKEEGLVASYIQLFQGLDVKVAQTSIREKIEHAEKGLLSCSPVEAEARIREMVALYPDPEVYRRAMRFFELTRRSEEAALFGLRLLDLLPNDQESLLQVAKVVVQDDFRIHEGPTKRSHQRLRKAADTRRLVTIAESAYKMGKLSIPERIRLADILEDIEENAKSFGVAMECLKSDEITNTDVRIQVTGIAARTALKLGKKEDAAKLISVIPASRLGGGALGNAAIQLKLEGGDKEGAFQIAKVILSRDFVPGMIPTALQLAQGLGRQNEVQELIQELMRANPEFEMRVMHDPELRWTVQRLGIDLDDFLDRTLRRRNRQ